MVVVVEEENLWSSYARSLTIHARIARGRPWWIGSYAWCAKKGEKEKLLFSRPPYIVAISHPRFRPVSAGRVKEEEISVRNDNEGATSYHPSSRDFFSFFLRRSSCDTCYTRRLWIGLFFFFLLLRRERGGEYFRGCTSEDATKRDVAFALETMWRHSFDDVWSTAVNAPGRRFLQGTIMLGSLASGLCAFVHVHRAAPRCMYARYTAKYRVFV